MPERGSSPSRPGGPKSLHLLAATSGSAPGGRCGRRRRPPPPARVSGTAAGGPPGGRRAPQPRSDGHRGGGGRSSGSKPSALAPTQRQPDGGGRAPEGGGLRGLRSGKPLEAGVRRAGRAQEASGVGGGWMCCSLASLLSFLKGFGDRAGFPGAGSHLTAAQPRLGCKSYWWRLLLAEDRSRLERGV